MSNTRQVAYNTVVQVVARLITTITSFVALGYLGRYLGVSGYGEYNLIFAYLALFGVVVDFGFFLLQVREVTKHPDREAYILGNVLGLKILLSVAAFVPAYFVSTVLYQDPMIAAGVAVGAISQTALALVNIPVSLFQARLQMQYVAAANVVSRLVYLGLTIWGVHQGFSLVQMIAVVAAVNVASFLAQQLLATKFSVVLPRWDFQYWWEFIKEAAPLGAAVVLAMIYFHIDTVLLSLMKGTYEVGIYGSAYKIVEVILTLPTIFMSSVFPVITRALAESKDRARGIFQKAFDFSALAGLPLAFGVMSLATPLMVLVFGADFAPSGKALEWLIWTTAISFFGAVLNYTIIASGAQRLLLWPYLWATIFNVVANWFVIPHYSYMGAAAVTVATELFVGGWVMWLIISRLGFVPQLTITLKALLASGLMFGVIKWLDLPSMAASIIVGAVVYIVVILATRAVSRDIYKEIFRIR